LNFRTGVAPGRLFQIPTSRAAGQFDASLASAASLPKRKPESPAEHYTHRIILNVFGKRFELTHRVDLREITKGGPAKVIEMPARRAIWTPRGLPHTGRTGHLVPVRSSNQPAVSFFKANPAGTRILSAVNYGSNPCRGAKLLVFELRIGKLTATVAESARKQGVSGDFQPRSGENGRNLSGPRLAGFQALCPHFSLYSPVDGSE
jgi:hypothetical protein